MLMLNNFQILLLPFNLLKINYFSLYDLFYLLNFEIGFLHFIFHITLDYSID